VRAIVIQHVEMEGPARIADLCAERGIVVDIHQVFAGDPVPERVGAADMLIVMGGGMGVGDLDDSRYPFLRAEIALLSAAIRDGRAVLGVCLGAQLLAHAAGARVYPNVTRDSVGNEVRVREVGWGPVSFVGYPDEATFRGLEPEQVVLHWHGDTFDLPRGAVHLASTPVCAQQAFRIGARIFGLQFHVEADDAIARRWVVEDADFVHAARGPGGIAQVIAETETHAATARVAGDQLIGNILDAMTAPVAADGLRACDASLMTAL
jgi:GMP synthase (glutamine-hydrolysing)